MNVLAVQRVGDGALLVQLADIAEVHGLTAWLRTLPVAEDLHEIVPAPRSVLIEAPAQALRQVQLALENAPTFPPLTHSDRVIQVDVVFDGLDLPEVCHCTGLTRAEFIDLHTGTEYVVNYFGFSPGHAYFGSLPAALRVPRRDSPRTLIAPNTLAVANEFCVIYPGGTPGGWSLLGTVVSEPFWDASSEPPNLVEVGDRVRFRAVS